MESRRLFETGAKRVKWVFVPLLILFAFVEIRLAGLQLVQGETYGRMAYENRVRISLIPPRRGRILDSAGRVLAEDRPVWRVAVNFHEAIEPEEIARAVASSKGAAVPVLARAIGSGWGKAFAPEVREIRRAALLALFDRLSAACGSPASKLEEAVRKAEREIFEFEGRERVRVAGLFLESPLMPRAKAREAVSAVEERILSRTLSAVPEGEFLAATGFRWDLENEARLERAEAYKAIAAAAGVSPAEVAKKTAELDRGCAARIVRTLKNGEHALIEGIGYEAVALIETDFEDFPGVCVGYSSGRCYPAGEASAHVVGYVGYLGHEMRGGKTVNIYEQKEQEGLFWQPVAELIDREQYESIEQSGEFHRDLFGKTGAELAWDSELRGRRGARIYERDRRNRIQRDLKISPPAHGVDVTLTIDSALQRSVASTFEAALSALPQGAEVRGAAVVMDVETGAVLAMVSVPSFDPNDLVPPVSGEAAAKYFASEGRPLMHRALAGLYPPGSTFKVVSALAALEEKIVDAQTKLSCGDGVFKYGLHKYRCWKRWGHGDVSLEYALEQSCNVYFYRVGKELGPALKRWAEMWGFGAPTGIELPGEKPGQLPPTRGGGWIHMSIGQRMTATPLQVARLMAVVGNGGRLVVPFVRQGGGVHPEWQVPVVSPGALEIVKRGLVRVVHGDDGTAALDLLIKARAAGKTGTAQTGRKANGVEINDAWFAGYAPFDKPAIAVAVVIESVPHGVHGGDVAAPVAAKIFEAALPAMSGSGILKDEVEDED